MADIYEQHRAAFARTEAYVILDGDKLVARVAFRFPADGAGRLYAYVHWIGSPMVRGFAAGGGYDKRTAACASAARKITDIGDRYHRLVDALSADAGQHWDGALRGAGFTVFQAC
jgi:hypothetical protein